MGEKVLPVYYSEYPQMTVRERKAAVFVSGLALARLLGWDRRNHHPERNMHYTLAVPHHTGNISKNLYRE